MRCHFWSNKLVLQHIPNNIPASLHSHLFAKRANRSGKRHLHCPPIWMLCVDFSVAFNTIYTMPLIGKAMHSGIEYQHMQPFITIPLQQTINPRELGLAGILYPPPPPPLPLGLSAPPPHLPSGDPGLQAQSRRELSRCCQMIPSSASNWDLIKRGNQPSCKVVLRDPSTAKYRWSDEDITQPQAIHPEVTMYSFHWLHDVFSWRQNKHIVWVLSIR